MGAQASPWPAVHPAPKHVFREGGAQSALEGHSGTALNPWPGGILPPAARDTQAKYLSGRFHAHTEAKLRLRGGNYAHEHLRMYQI